jgi:hypothetical protein
MGEHHAPVSTAKVESQRRVGNTGRPVIFNSGAVSDHSDPVSVLVADRAEVVWERAAPSDRGACTSCVLAGPPRTMPRVAAEEVTPTTLRMYLSDDRVTPTSRQGSDEPLVPLPRVSTISGQSTAVAGSEAPGGVHTT